MLVVSAKMVQSICMVLKIVLLIIFFFFSENPKVFYTHSVIVDMVKNVQFLKDSMETTYEISNLI